MRLYNAKNRAKVLAQRAIGRQKRRLIIRAQNRTYYLKNRQAFLTRCALYRGKNVEKIRAYHARRYANRTAEIKEKEKRRLYAHFLKNREKYRIASLNYAAKNRDKVNDRAKKWAKDNPTQVHLSHGRRRARKKNNLGKLSRGLIERLLLLQQKKCAICYSLLKKYHLDHIVPLALGGKHEDLNMQILCPGCNLAKAARHPIRHMQLLGKLL